MLTKAELDTITFIVPDWKIPFYQFVGGKISLEEFERVLYERTEIESEVGEEIYVDLITFNFRNRLNYNDVVRYILEKILVDETEFRCKLYALIGEFYLTEKWVMAKESESLTEAVVSTFGGSHIKVNWNGIETSACDIRFLYSAKQLTWAKVDCRHSLPSSTRIIGYACHSHIELLMDEDGIIYIYLNIIDQLHIGGSFLEALTILFCGLEYGKLICPEKSR